MVMFVSVYSFGVHIKGDVLNNVEEVEEWESYVLRGIFLLIMITHTPFIFFIGKESLLALIGLCYRSCEKRMRRRMRAQRRSLRKSRATLKKQNLIENEVRLGKSEVSNFNAQEGSNNKYDIVKTNTLNDTFMKDVDNESDASDSEGSDTSSEFGYQSESEIILMNTVDLNLSKAIGKSQKVVENGPDYEINEEDEQGNVGDESGAEDILPNWLYYTITLTLYAIVVGIACVLEDVEAVIKYVGSMANATLNMTLPGLFYIIIMRRSKVNKLPWWKLIPAFILTIYGLFIGIGLTGVNIWTTISPVEEHEDL